MDYILASIFTLLSVLTGYFIGSEKKVRKLNTKISRVKEEIKKKINIKLGTISRPNAEDIEKKQNPKLKEEEEAWDEGFKI